MPNMMAFHWSMYFSHHSTGAAAKLATAVSKSAGINSADRLPSTEGTRLASASVNGLLIGVVVMAVIFSSGGSAWMASGAAGVVFAFAGAASCSEGISWMSG